MAFPGECRDPANARLIFLTASVVSDAQASIYRSKTQEDNLARIAGRK
jgi:hypothetical protein